ncbi:MULTISPECIES: TolC family protein [Chryseobacterium]|uniref:Outer membrane protein TolC n=1 Tax=Chryseobacterium salivictor TaxID=2547600 RepID=A0A4P6ZHV6_9FLAO|nr:MULTISPECIES: TolC family protein [Chryseobacterium]MDQ0475813.1 outer membrane protein [Chryseobacterium sp. MDT2-18]QBO59242.1 Outer membrane protein TolC [Chryseobacterium salivictor]
MKKILQFFAITTFSSMAFAQQSFSLDESWQYAIDHNVNVKKAKIDKTIAGQKVKETIGIGLPQLDGQAKYNYFLNVPVQLLPAELAGGDPGTYIPVKFGQKQSMTGGLTLSQLLFSGSYIVGLQASKAYKETAALAEEKTEISVKEGIMMAYAAVLVTDENIKTLEENRKVVEKSLYDTKETYKVGLIEYQNVEQLEYSYKSLLANQQNLNRSREKVLMALKYLMGYPLEDKLTLTSTLDQLIKKNETLVDMTNFINNENHIDIRLKENALTLSELEFKLEKSKSLPTLSAAVASNYNGYSDQFNFLKSSQQWFNTSVVAVQLDIPIFSGFQRHWRTQQAKLNLEKAKLDVEDIKRDLSNKAFAATIDYNNAYNSYKNSEELITLSSSIYNKERIKFNEGLGTSFDLQQSETQLYDSQAKYYQAAIELIQAKTKLDEALGTL